MYKIVFVTVVKETVIFNCCHVLGMYIVLCNLLSMGNVYLKMEVKCIPVLFIGQTN